MKKRNNQKRDEMKDMIAYDIFKQTSLLCDPEFFDIFSRVMIYREDFIGYIPEVVDIIKMLFEEILEKLYERCEYEDI